MAEEKNWITLKNGVHIPVEENQSNKEATKTFLQKLREKKANQSKEKQKQIEKNTKLAEEKNKKIEKDYQKIRTKEYLKSVKENPKKEILFTNSNNSWLLSYTDNEGWETVKHGQVVKKYKDRQEAYNDWDNGYFEEDSATQDKKEIDINGYELRYDVPMTKIGVFPYLGKTISPELEPDRIYYVLRPKEELTNEETLKSLEEIPFVDEHTMIGEGFTPAEQKGIHGITGKNVKVSGDLITNDLKIYSDKLKKLIDSGKRDLSMGYRCRYELSKGEYNGQPYDAIQRDIRFNHIALVDEGRMGAECRITDNAIVYDRLDITQEKEFKEMSEKTKKFTLDEDLKEEIKNELKEEIKADLLNGGEVIEEGKKEEIVDECDPAKDEEEKKPVMDEDKRKLIDEIGGILKDKVDEELLRTVLKKAEELAYNPSETGANDEEPQKPCDDEEPEEEKKEDVSMDEMFHRIALRDELVEKVRPLIGDNINYKKMNVEQVVKYSCDKLDIKPSLNGLKGYLKANEKYQRDIRVTVATDSKNNLFMTAEQSPAIKEYLGK